MVSNAREDFPEPEMPEMTTSLSRGISTEMFFRLCWRAPMTTILSCAMQHESEEFYWGLAKGDYNRPRLRSDGKEDSPKRGEARRLDSWGTGQFALGGLAGGGRGALHHWHLAALGGTTASHCGQCVRSPGGRMPPSSSAARRPTSDGLNSAVWEPRVIGAPPRRRPWASSWTVNPW